MRMQHGSSTLRRLLRVIPDPFVYDSSVALIRAAPQVTAEATELQNFLIDLTPALAQADPRTPEPVASD